VMGGVRSCGLNMRPDVLLRLLLELTEGAHAEQCFRTAPTITRPWSSSLQ
jgi:hypothetical protein